jgi:fatty-acyl-CoA synthase
MMDYPLTLRSIYERARTLFPDKQLATRRGDGVERTTYGDWAERVARLAGALREIGVGPGDRVATFCWNHDRHLEAYFATALMGASYHTLNIRLGGDQLAYICNHAGDKVLIADAELAPAIGPVLPSLDTVEHVLVLAAGERPSLGFRSEHDYEALVERAAPLTDWPALDEDQTAGICYTSATTGNPKGVAYSHRALFLHSLMVGLVDTAAICERDVLLPIVPMFHVNAWGMPFAATWYGAGQVYGGAAPTPADYLRLIREQGVTVSAGVPTVWLGILQLLDQQGGDLGQLERILCGGSAAPVSMIRAYEERYGVQFVHAYGMTEASPVTHFSRLKANLWDLPVEARFSYKAKQGILVPGLEQRVVDADGQQVPADGKSMGELQLRGPWIASEYLDDERSAATFVDGWYHTGDVATLDGDGYLHLVDRTKDLVKSGGEWISSVELENALMGHPQVAEAAVIAVPDEKWGERPLAVVVRKPGGDAGEAELVASIADKFPKWWLPEHVEFVDELPKTATGKFSKRQLRDRFVARVREEEGSDER